ncbi:hypothetical protein [Flavobacterium sp.]|jgi:uncharacterized membrane protein YvbJ|uniref:hypothetical protein n=1 Tax=Flavobacterium sp. TaxID=239 RepID=UPI00391B199A
MEKENWISTILNSINGITKVSPSDDLFFKIQNKIKRNNVSPKTVWLVAASIAILVLLNFTLLATKTKESSTTTTTYLENTLNQSNQIYQ